MNTGTLSATAATPTVQAIDPSWDRVQIQNHQLSTGTIAYAPGVAVDPTKDSTIQPSNTGVLYIPKGVTTIALCSVGGTAWADIAAAQTK